MQIKRGPNDGCAIVGTSLFVFFISRYNVIVFIIPNMKNDN